MANKKTAKGKRKSILFKIVSTANTGYYYLVRRNPKNTPDKISLKKYDPKIRQHVIFKETKLSS